MTPDTVRRASAGTQVPQTDRQPVVARRSGRRPGLKELPDDAGDLRDRRPQHVVLASVDDVEPRAWNPLGDISTSLEWNELIRLAVHDERSYPKVRKEGPDVARRLIDEEEVWFPSSVWAIPRKIRMAES